MFESILSEGNGRRDEGQPVKACGEDQQVLGQPKDPGLHLALKKLPKE